MYDCHCQISADRLILIVHTFQLCYQMLPAINFYRNICSNNNNKLGESSISWSNRPLNLHSISDTIFQCSQTFSVLNRLFIGRKIIWKLYAKRLMQELHYFTQKFDVVFAKSLKKNYPKFQMSKKFRVIVQQSETFFDGILNR